MLFNSFDFFLFLFIVLITFWLLPAKFKWIFLLISSYFFYAQWNPIYLLLLIFTTVIDYTIALKITSSKAKFKSKLGIYLSVIMNLGVLFIFKYYNFFHESIKEIYKLFSIEYNYNTSTLLLPVGISFYTFQVLSYSIDVYKKVIVPEKRIGKFALFVSFFPQLVAGPIERAKDLLPQINKQRFRINSENARIGLLYIFWGLFQKVAIADNIATLVDKVYENPLNVESGLLLYTVLLFSFQIYTDFAGYSNMAVGIAKLFGYELTLNFKSPYLSPSISIFWKNWHISLSRWVKDYIYIPLGGNRISVQKTYINLIITFFIVGLWHGASFNFIFWGLLNGLFLILERLLHLKNESKNTIVNSFRIILTFVLISLIWVPFRAKSISETIDIFKKIMFDFKLAELKFWIVENISSIFIIPLILLISIELIIKKRNLESILTWKKHQQILFFLMLIFTIILTGKTNGGAFIYFQF